MGPSEVKAAAREAWPAFRFEDDFVGYVTARGWPNRSLALDDLALAWACLSAQPGAIAELTRHVRPALAAGFGRAVDADRPDLEQALWLKLFTGTPPGLAQYSGVGSLRGWVRVSLSRLVVNHVTRGRLADDSESALLEQLAPQADPELAALKRDLAGDFQAALTAAFLSLTSRERALLRQLIGQGATVDQVAVALSVPRSTAGRHVKDARERFAAALRDELGRNFGAESVSARRVLELVESQLDLRWLDVTRVKE